MAGRLKLEITPKIQEAYAVKDDLTLGRSPSNDIVLLDGAVSRVHARVFVRPDGVWLRDEKSANGVLVNGTKITEVRLAEGDRVQIGAKHLVFTEAPALPEKPGTVVDLTKKPLASYDMKAIVEQADVLLVIPTIEPLMEMIYEIVAQMILHSALEGEAQQDFITAVQEAVRNGATHGNKWNPGRTLQLRYARDPDKVVSLVRDAGPGFDYKEIMERGRKIGRRTVVREAFLEGKGPGRGVVRMLAAVDQVEYNETGNEVILTKYVHRQGTGDTKWGRAEMPTIQVHPRDLAGGGTVRRERPPGSG